MKSVRRVEIQHINKISPISTVEIKKMEKRHGLMFLHGLIFQKFRSSLHCLAASFFVLYFIWYFLYTLVFPHCHLVRLKKLCFTNILVYFSIFQQNKNIYDIVRNFNKNYTNNSSSTQLVNYNVIDRIDTLVLYNNSCVFCL